MGSTLDEMQAAQMRRMEFLKARGVRCSRGSVAGSIVIYASDAAKLVRHIKRLERDMNEVIVENARDAE